jgi:hypothetical protein
MTTNLQDIFDTAGSYSFRSHSTETKKNISKTQQKRHKEYPVTDTTKQRISAALTGKKRPKRCKCLVTPWGEFESVHSFWAWAKTAGLPDPKNNLRRARKLLPDQFYIKDKE